MSRFLPCLAFAATLTLAACTAAPDEQQLARDQAVERAQQAAQPQPVGAPAVDAAACDPVQAQWLVGTTPSEAEIEQARTDAGAQSVRSLRPNEVVTMEFNDTRLNLEVDEAGVVQSVRCG